MHHTPEDVADAPPNHLRLAGTPIEVVAYPVSDDLILLVNRAGTCVYRERLPGVMSKTFEPAEFLVYDRHAAHRHVALMREYIEHHPLPPWRRRLRRWFIR